MKLHKTIPAYLFLCFVHGMIIAQAIDSKTILDKSSEACKNTKMIEYEVSTKSNDGITVNALIIQGYANTKDVGFGTAKVLVKGIMNTPNKAQHFKFSYNGTSFKFYEDGKGGIKTINDPTPRTVGRTLGLFYYNLVLSQFTLSNGIDAIINRLDSAIYKGITTINGAQVYQLAITQSFPHPVTKQKISSTSEWYFDTKTYLPIKIKFKGYEKTMNILSRNKPINDTIFDINNNQLVEQIVTGMEPNTENLMEKGSQFPDFELTDIDGNQVTLNQLLSKVTIIDFWGTWCGPCVLAMPELQQLYDKYNLKGLNVVGISVKDTADKVEKFITNKGFNYLFLVNGDDFARQIKIDTYPSIYIIDSEGLILHAEKGRRDGSKEYFDNIIRNQLQLSSKDSH